MRAARQFDAVIEQAEAGRDHPRIVGVVNQSETDLIGSSKQRWRQLDAAQDFHITACSQAAFGQHDSDNSVRALQDRNGDHVISGSRTCRIG